MKAIEFKHVGKEDPFLRIGDSGNQEGEDFVWALRDIDFSVEQGDVVGIIGKNGAGKSTLLKLLSRVTAPTIGEIDVRGRIASLLEVGTGFHPEMTGRENIYLNGAIMGMTKAEVTRRFDEIVDFSGCGRYIDTPVKRYSSGMKVRLGFSVAAHLEPEILVVDEVLAVGDAEFQKKAIGKMQDVSRGNGRTVLFVSHNMAAVRSLCQKGVVLRDGRTDFIGTAEDAIQHYLGTVIEQSGEKKLITDSITKCKSYLKISEIQINNTPYNSTTISNGQEVLDVFIKGTTQEPMRCEVRLIIKNPGGSPLASYVPGNYNGSILELQPGDFTVERHIRLPKYMGEGNYFIDLQLHEPYCQDFFEAKDCQMLHIEGFFDPYTRPITLPYEGFLGLESASNSNGL